MADRVRIPDLLDARSRGDLAVEDRFFSNLQLRTGVYKLTSRHRFDDTLAATLAQNSVAPAPIPYLHFNEFSSAARSAAERAES